MIYIGHYFTWLTEFIYSHLYTRAPIWPVHMLGLALTDLEVAQHQIMKIPDRSCPTDSSDMYLICI